MGSHSNHYHKQQATLDNMCRLIRYVHADCGCADRDGRMPKTDNSSKHELAWIHFCKDAMQTADAYQTKTKICGGGIVSDLNMEVLTMERMFGRAVMQRRLGESRIWEAS